MSRGRLVYKIKYVTAEQKLMVTVERVEGLKKEKGLLGGKVDPYVRLFLMPGTHNELKTKVMKNNLDPTFNDEFSFVISPTDVIKKTIVFQVWDSDLGKDDPLGEVQVPLWTRGAQMEGFSETVEMDAITNDANSKGKPVLREKRPSRSMSTVSVGSHGSSASASSLSQRRSVLELNTAGGYYKPQSEVFQQQSSSFARDSLRSSSVMGGGSLDRLNAGGTTTYSYQESHEHRSQSRRSSSSSSASGSTRIQRTGLTTLSLKELNDRLEKYIAQISMVPEHNTHSIRRVTERTSSSVDITAMHEYREYEALLAEYLREEEVIANIEADIKEYEHKNGFWLKCNEEVDVQIRELEGLISSKRENIRLLEEKVRIIESEKMKFEQDKKERERELHELQSRVESVPAGWKEKVATMEMNNVRASINNDRKTFMSRLSNLEWEENTVTQDVDIATLRKEIAADYDRKLKEELKHMKYLYNDHITGVKLDIKNLYAVKKSELDAMLANLSGASRVEVDRILAEISRAKQEIIALEEEKLKLTQRERELGDKLEEERVSHEAMLKAKREEVAFLEREYSSLRVEYQSFESAKASHASEVARYESLIKPAEHKIKIHAQPFIDETEIAPVEESSSSSSSSSSSEDEDGQKRPRNKLGSNLI